MLTFNWILQHQGIDPKTVFLLRHQDNRRSRAMTPYSLWRANDGRFEIYQSIQRQGRFQVGNLLASFVANPLKETLFAGLFTVQKISQVAQGLGDSIFPGEDLSNDYFYDVLVGPRLDEYKGRLVINWGMGFRSWVQRAGTQDKPILELRRQFEDPPFPGYMLFIKPLSEIETLPIGWAAILQMSKGVYLLTCPRTREQYVGSASGVGGFWDRWQDYAHTGHGGNVALKSRDPSDYQVSILEVAGSAATLDDIYRMEQRWKEKLRSTEMGLNRN
jgi:hypothetical protein